MRFEQLLRGSAALTNVSDQLINRLAAEASIQQLSVGQPFQRAGQLPPGAALLLEGRLRRLQLRPGETPLSLGLASPGSWLGWSSLWRGEPELGLVASQPSTLLVVPALPALRLLQQEPELRQAVAGRPCLEELASLMEVWWRAQGQRPAQPKQQLELLLAEALLLGPEDRLPPGHLLLYSGPRQPDGLLPGDQLQSDSEGWRQPVNQLPPRVVAIPEAALNASASPPTAPAAMVPVAAVASLGASDPIELGFVDSRPRPDGSSGETNPAADRVEQAYFCIQQLCQARELVVSGDQLMRNLRDVEERLGALKLPQVGLQLEALGFDTRPLRARAWELARLEPPAVLDLEGQFVLLLVAGRGSGVLISDPRRGPVRLGLAQLEQRCPDGLDVLVVREGRAGRDDVEKVGLGWFGSAFARYPGMVTMVLLTGFISQVLDLVLPLSFMVVLDAVVARNNPSLLAPILVLLVVATLVNGVIGSLRALVTADLSDRVDVRMGSSVVEHLLRLPLPYFESRQVGAILYNVNQLYAIRRFVVDQVLGAGLDLALGLLVFVVLFVISPTLTLITMAVVPLLIGLNFFGAPLIERNLQISNRSLAAANSYLVELLSGMRTVKSQNFEVEARWRWLDRYRRYTNSRFRLTRLSALLGRGRPHHRRPGRCGADRRGRGPNAHQPAQHRRLLRHPHPFQPDRQFVRAAGGPVAGGAGTAPIPGGPQPGDGNPAGSRQLRPAAAAPAAPARRPALRAGVVPLWPPHPLPARWPRAPHPGRPVRGDCGPQRQWQEHPGAADRSALPAPEGHGVARWQRCGEGATRQPARPGGLRAPGRPAV